MACQRTIKINYGNYNTRNTKPRNLTKGVTPLKESGVFVMEMNNKEYSVRKCFDKARID